MRITSAGIAAVSTALTLAGIVGYFTGPVTLELPVAGAGRAAEGLGLGSSGHYTSLEAAVPDLPAGPAVFFPGVRR